MWVLIGVALVVVGIAASRPAGSTRYRIGRVVVWLGAIVGGWIFGTDVVERRAQNHPVTIAALLVAAGLCAYGVYSWQERRSERRRRAWDDARWEERKGWSDQEWKERSVPSKPDF